MMTHVLAATHAASGGMVPVLVYPQAQYHGSERKATGSGTVTRVWMITSSITKPKLSLLHYLSLLTLPFHLLLAMFFLR